jgi:hypothetical protein
LFDIAFGGGPVVKPLPSLCFDEHSGEEVGAAHAWALMGQGDRVGGGTICRMQPAVNSANRTRKRPLSVLEGGAHSNFSALRFPGTVIANADVRTEVTESARAAFMYEFKRTLAARRPHAFTQQDLRPPARPPDFYPRSNTTRSAAQRAGLL